MELLQAYLVSIGIYFVVVLALLELFTDRIIENGWLDGCEVSEDENPYLPLFLICAVPVFRLWQCISIFVMAFHAKDEFEDE